MPLQKRQSGFRVRVVGGVRAGTEVERCLQQFCNAELMGVQFRFGLGAGTKAWKAGISLSVQGAAKAYASCCGVNLAGSRVGVVVVGRVEGATSCEAASCCRGACVPEGSACGAMPFWSKGVTEEWKVGIYGYGQDTARAYASCCGVNLADSGWGWWSLGRVEGATSCEAASCCRGACVPEGSACGAVPFWSKGVTEEWKAGIYGYGQDTARAYASCCRVNLADSRRCWW